MESMSENSANNETNNVAVEEKALNEEILKSGFLLECRTAQIFLDCGHDVEQNLLSEFPSNHVPNRLREIDVLAIRAPNESVEGSIYVVECKGASPKDKLVLNPSAEIKYRVPRFSFQNGRVKLIGKDSITCNVGNKRYYCHTGDFFSRQKKGEFQRSGKQDEKNNLFHGITQLHDGLDAAFRKYRKLGNYEVFPLIVTNVEILIAHFAPGKRNIGQEVHTESVPWAICRTPLVYPSEDSKISREPWLHDDDESSCKVFTQARRVPGVYVCERE